MTSVSGRLFVADIKKARRTRANRYKHFNREAFEQRFAQSDHRQNWQKL
jgi:hypothetical protein